MGIGPGFAKTGYVDLFYYGSQDVPALRRDTRWALPRNSTAETAVCESCSAPIGKPDLLNGRAAEVYGLYLCERCRLRSRAEERVELYFCDRCHVSVPVYRVDTGEALAGDGRILCLACRQRPDRRLTLVVLFSAVLLALSAGGALSLEHAGSRSRAAAARKARADRLLDRVQSVVDRLPALEKLGADASAVPRIQMSLAALGARATQTSRALDGAASSLVETRVEFLRRMEIVEGESLSLLRAIDGVTPTPPGNR